jgi:hypothetical protein
MRQFRAVCGRIANIKDSLPEGVEFEPSDDFLNWVSKHAKVSRRSKERRHGSFERPMTLPEATCPLALFCAFAQDPMHGVQQRSTPPETIYCGAIDPNRPSASLFSPAVK